MCKAALTASSIPSTGDTHQTDTALAAFREGGWLGRGPGEGVVRPNLPDAYTDYIFAAIGEEFGLIFCLFLVCLYGFIVWRGFRAAGRSQDPFIRLALSGLMMLFGFQTLINMAVNVDLLPAKGMTLAIFVLWGVFADGDCIDDGAGARTCQALARGSFHLRPRAAAGGRRGFLQGDKDLTGASIVLTAGGTGGHLFPGPCAGGRTCAAAAMRSI